jgi:hypothetical protein
MPLVELTDELDSMAETSVNTGFFSEQCPAIEVTRNSVRSVMSRCAFKARRPGKIPLWTAYGGACSPRRQPLCSDDLATRPS